MFFSGLVVMAFVGVFISTPLEGERERQKAKSRKGDQDSRKTSHLIPLEIPDYESPPARSEPRARRAGHLLGG